MGVCECKNRTDTDKDEHKQYASKLAALQRYLKEAQEKHEDDALRNQQERSTAGADLDAELDDESIVESYESSDFPSDQESGSENEEEE